MDFQCVYRRFPVAVWVYTVRLPAVQQVFDLAHLVLRAVLVPDMGKYLDEFPIGIVPLRALREAVRQEPRQDAFLSHCLNTSRISDAAVSMRRIFPETIF